ncbi:MAG: hypothetical protein AB1640_10110 [bacterium]
MRTNGDALKPLGSELLDGWRVLRSWAERTWSREMIAEAGLVGSTLALCAFVLYCLGQGLSQQVLIGF